MGLREWMNRNPLVTTVIFAVVLMIAVAMAVARSGGASQREAQTYGYFYDLSSHELFVDSNRRIPPIRDGQGVVARVFSCGECADKDSRFVAWLEMYTPEAKASLNPPPASSTDEPPDPQMAANPQIETGHLIALEPQADQPPQWTSIESAGAAQIRRMVVSRCAGGHPKACFPGPDELP